MKGDRVQLLERDDEFGDGWYLGKHLVNGNSGLFPEGRFTAMMSGLRTLGLTCLSIYATGAKTPHNRTDIFSLEATSHTFG